MFRAGKIYISEMGAFPIAKVFSQKAKNVFKGMPVTPPNEEHLNTKDRSQLYYEGRWGEARVQVEGRHNLLSRGNLKKSNLIRNKILFLKYYSVTVRFKSSVCASHL